MAWPRTWLRQAFNAGCFQLRETLAFSRGLPRVKNEDKAALFAFLEPGPRAAAEEWEERLRRSHGLDALREHSSLIDYRECLVTLHALERLVGEESLGSDSLRALDAGAGAWNYVVGLARFLERQGVSRHARTIELIGLEVDGHGLYPDFRSRADHARARAQQAGPGVRLELGDVRDHGFGRFGVVSLLFPFLTEAALLAWGLPLSLFAPAAILRAAVDSLEKGGFLLVFNQTLEEAERLAEILAPLDVETLVTVPLPCEHVPYWEQIKDRTGTLARRREG